jgi:hypothetical protein
LTTLRHEVFAAIAGNQALLPKKRPSPTRQRCHRVSVCRLVVRLLVLNWKLPMKFEGFMYLDVEDPMIAWNTYRGVLVSQERIQQSTGEAAVPALSMTMARLLMDQNLNRLAFESELEATRVMRFNHLVSRLTGLYVFDSPDSALTAAQEDWGGHLVHENLIDVGVSAAPNITRVDANWITWMLATRASQGLNWREGIVPYWEGKSCPHHGSPIWEVLVDGAVTLWGTALRDRAYQTTKARSPNALALLEQSRLAATLGSDLGHVCALITLEKDVPLMSFHIDMRDATDPAYCSKLAHYVKCNPQLVNHRDLAVGGDSFRTPDFLAYSHAFQQ